MTQSTEALESISLNSTTTYVLSDSAPSFFGKLGYSVSLKFVVEMS